MTYFTLDLPGHFGNNRVPAGDLALSSTTLGWRLVNAQMPAEWTVSLGEATDQLRQRHGIARERVS